MVDPLTSLASGRYGRAYRRAVRAALAPAYRFYTERLRREVMARPRPHHVAVIMDGNRRWAMREGYADHRRRPPARRRESARDDRLVRRPRHP